MSVVKQVPFSYFLTERKVRIKPTEANALGLKRVDKIDFSANIHLSDRPTNTDMILVKPGDLLISGINAEKGAVTVYQGEEDVLASIHYSSYEYNREKIDIEFLKWFLKSANFKNLLLKNSTGGIKTELKAKHLLPLELDLPDPKAQKSIVRLIESHSTVVNEIFSEISFQLADLQRLRQSILQEAVQGKLVPQDKNDEPASELLKKIKAEKEALVKAGKLKKEKPLSPISEDEIPFELPKGWVWCRLGEVVNLITKGSSPKWQGVNYTEKEEVLFVTSENVDSYSIDLTKRKYVENKFNEIEPRSILRKGDFLMNIVGASIGRTAQFNLDEKANINQAVCLIRKETYLILDIFLLHFFNSPICVGYMFDKQVDNARPNLSMGNIERFIIPLPPLAEQHLIVSKVESLMQTCHALETELKLAQVNAGKLLQAVLREAFEQKSPVEKAEQHKADPFFQMQLLGLYIKKMKDQPQPVLQGEMGLAKYAFLCDNIFGVHSGFQYQQHNFGPYAPEIRQRLTSPNKYFAKTGTKGFEVYTLGAKSDALFKYKSSELQKAENAIGELITIFGQYKKERSHKLELLASVSWLIQQLKTTDFDQVWQGLKDWKTPKRKQKNKSDIFTETEVKQCIGFIVKRNWHLKLMKTE